MRRGQRRRGTALPVITLCTAGLFGCMALAIDVGMVAVARTEAQNAADSAAMAGARTLNGDVANNNNYSAAGPAAQIAASANSILGKTASSSQTNVEFGSYSYSSAQEKFLPIVPKPSADNWTLCKATVTMNNNQTYFAKVFGNSTFNLTTTATAVHRPRDVAIILDFSGSMRFATLQGIPHGNARQVTGYTPTSGTNNPENVFPRFGAYADTNAAGLQRTSPVTSAAGDVYALSNFTEASGSNNYVPPVVEDFYQHASGTPNKAFTKAADGDGDGWVSGDKHGKKNTSGAWAASGTYVADTTFAETVKQLLNLASVDTSTRDWRWELDGYALLPNPTVISDKTDYTQAPFAGYTQGPRYWGQSFFLWPPDPRYPLTNSATDRDVVKQFLKDFISDQGSPPYTTGDVTDVTKQIYNVWNLWPQVSAGALQGQLTAAGLNSTSIVYQRIMRLYNRPKADWRKRFFLKTDGVTPVNDTSLLWTSTGIWRSPSHGGTDYYKINYQAILEWLFTSPINPFPPRMKAGRIVYYDALPSYTDNGLNARWWGTIPPADLNERFWKEYIDYTLGLRQTSTTAWDTQSGSIPHIVAYTGYGDDYTWGTKQITALSSLTFASGSTAKPYIHYADNPARPRLHFWFGPMTMVDFLGNYNMAGRTNNQSHWWWPGTCHENPLYAAKLGIRAALQDIEKNHPNDSVAEIMFSVPRSSATDTTNARRFNRVRAPLGRNYTRMIDSLWYPTYSLDNNGATIRPYDFEANLGVPRAMGGTCYSMGLMLAYNQFSGRTDLRTYNPSPAPNGDAGGLGRKGAQKLVIFETDGLPNNTATASFISAGSYNSYYAIRYNSSTPSSSDFPSVASSSDNSAAVTSQIFGICQQIVALDNAANPGFGTTRRPVLIHTIGFGPAVEPGSADLAGALATLGQMETIGNIPAAKRIDAVSYKTIYGSPDQMISGLRTALNTIMQDGVQVTLIE